MATVGNHAIGYERFTNNWLGRKVSFTLCGNVFTGTVVETETFWGGGWHEIVTVEIDNDPKQVKVSLHRQACKRMEKVDHE